MTAQVDAFHLAAKVLNEAGVRWWLSDGAVLGAVREGRLLAGDPDVDLGVWLADMPTVGAAFIEAGWPLKRDRPGQLWPTHGGIKVDIHGHELVGDRVRYELARGRLAYEFPAALFERMTTVHLHGYWAWTPSPPEEYLVAHYGVDWRIPRARWRWDRDPPCIVSGSVR